MGEKLEVVVLPQMQEGGEVIENLRTCVDVRDSDILGGMEGVQSLQS